ncbi:MAG: hypothetical protein SOZ65_02340 [Erysipelotrichaceae bacterium]|nr:hypothetical protein [Erysipelotrichaceae bacterium]
MEELLRNKYIQKQRVVETLFRDEMVEYLQVYYIDSLTNDEVYFKSIEKENKLRLIDGYKRLKGLLSSIDIREIRNKYDLTQKEYSYCLGLGEVTIHRYEKGAVQSYSDNQLMVLSRDVELFRQMLEHNKTCFSQQRYIQLKERVNQLAKIEQFQLVKYTNLLELDDCFAITDVLSIANYLKQNYLKKYPYQKDISIQKINCLLFFVKGLAYQRYHKACFEDSFQLKNNSLYLERMDSYRSSNQRVYLTTGLAQLCDLVIEKYGCFNYSYLYDLIISIISKKDFSDKAIKEKFKEIYL